MVRRNLLLAAAAVAPILLGSSIASATAYGVQVWEGTATFGNSTARNATAAGVNALTTGGTYTSATFTWNGTLNFDWPGLFNPNPPNATYQNTDSTGDLFSQFFGSNPGVPNNNTASENPAALISGYSCTHNCSALGSPSNANFNTLSSFLASSGSAASYLYGAIFKIDLGKLPAGTILAVRHDDGASLVNNGVTFGSLTSTPTSATGYQTGIVPSATYDTYLYYAYQNGSPEVLQVTFNGSQQNPLPEPTSMAVLATGLLGLGFMARRRSLRG